MHILHILASWNGRPLAGAMVQSSTWPEEAIPWRLSGKPLRFYQAKALLDLERPVVDLPYQTLHVQRVYKTLSLGSEALGSVLTAVIDLSHRPSDSKSGERDQVATLPSSARVFGCG